MGALSCIGASPSYNPGSTPAIHVVLATIGSLCLCKMHYFGNAKVLHDCKNQFDCRNCHLCNINLPVANGVYEQRCMHPCTHFVPVCANSSIHGTNSWLLTGSVTGRPEPILLQNTPVMLFGIAIGFALLCFKICS